MGMLPPLALANTEELLFRLSALLGWSDTFDEDEDMWCTFGLDNSTSRPFDGDTGRDDSFFGDLGRVKAKA